jgi:hypothetical protein
VLVRAALTAATAAAAAAALLWLGLSPVRALQHQLAAGRAWTALPPDLVLTALAATVTSMLGLWLAVAAVATAVEVVVGCSSRLARSVSPTLVRRTVLLCCGLAVGGTVAAPATAFDAPGPGRQGLQRYQGHQGHPGLAGLRLPDRPTGAMAAEPLATERPASPVAAVQPRPAAATESLPRHVVERGECLWSIAAGLLPHDADDSEIGAAWRELYRRNRRVVGDDPHLLHTGTVLVLPAALVAERPVAAHPTREEAS